MVRRSATALTSAVILLALLAPSALAYQGGDGGQGWIGVADDKRVTEVGFLVIALFPFLALVFSLILWQLDKRKDARKAAAKARKARSGLHAGH